MKAVPFPYSYRKSCKHCDVVIYTLLSALNNNLGGGHTPSIIQTGDECVDNL